MSNSTTSALAKNTGWAILRSRQAFSIPLLLLIGLTVFLRVYNLGAESYWQDELIMIRVTTSGIDEIIDQTAGGRPPLYVILGAIWAEIWGTSESATRSLSAIFSTGAVIVLYILAREWFDERVAIISSLLMALSTFQIHHAQDHRYYALLLLLATVSFLFYFRALNGRRWRDFILWGICGAAAYYTHSHALFVLIAQGIFFILQWPRYKQGSGRWFVSVIGIGLITLPGLYFQFRNMLAVAEEFGEPAVLTWLPEPTLAAPVLTGARFFFNNVTADQFITLGIGAAIFVIGTVGFIASRGLPTWINTVRHTSAATLQAVNRYRPQVILLACWLVIPILLPFVLSFVTTSMYLDRYMIATSPALYLITALGVLMFRKVIPLYASLGSLIVMLVIALYMFYANDYKEPWNQVAAYVETQTGPNDAIAVSHITSHSYPGIFDSFAWYYTGEQPLCHIIETDLDQVAHRNEVDECLGDIERLWIPIIVVPWDDTEGRIALFNEFLSERELSVRIAKEYTGLYVLVAE
jgi:mannosyltransferase